MNKKYLAITGGSRGIGFSVAKKFIQNNAKQNLILISKNHEHLSRAKKKLQEINPNVDIITIATDLSSHSFVKDLNILKELSTNSNSQINGLIFSHGKSFSKILLSSSEQAIAENIDLNLTANMLLTKYFLKNFFLRPNLISKPSDEKDEFKTHQNTEKTDGISIINISSVIAIKGNLGQSIYAAGKAGLIGFTKSLAREIGGRNIRVNCVLPGFIDTDMTRDIPIELKAKFIDDMIIKRFGDPEEIADACYFLHNNKYITGQALTIDGGLSV
ncbi:hypothetical protein HDU92_006183 [Lobulomyces angularis]|nr:hypothetical protein HDU92_006183 [Lobulomyces angularis]